MSIVLTITLAIFLTSITSAFSQETVDSLAVQKGEQIYKANCTSCHMMTDKALIGPGLKGVTDRRTKEWLKKWINSEDKFLKSDMRLGLVVTENINIDTLFTGRFVHDNLFWNYRLGGLQAAFGIESLKAIDSTIEYKIKQATYYNYLFSNPLFFYHDLIITLQGLSIL